MDDFTTSNVAHVRPMIVSSESSQASEPEEQPFERCGPSAPQNSRRKEPEVDFSKVLNIEPIDEEIETYKTVRLCINGVTKDVLVPVSTILGNISVQSSTKDSHVVTAEEPCSTADGEKSQPQSSKSSDRSIEKLVVDLEEQVCQQLGASGTEEDGRIRSLISELRTQVVEKIHPRSNSLISDDDVIVIAPDSPQASAPTEADKFQSDPGAHHSESTRHTPSNIVIMNKGKQKRPCYSIESSKPASTKFSASPDNTVLVKTVMPRMPIVQTHSKVAPRRPCYSTVKPSTAKLPLTKSAQIAAANTSNLVSGLKTGLSGLKTGQQLPGFMGSDGKFYIQVDTKVLGGATIPHSVVGSISNTITRTTSSTSSNMVLIDPSKLNQPQFKSGTLTVPIHNVAATSSFVVSQPSTVVKSLQLKQPDISLPVSKSTTAPKIVMQGVPNRFNSSNADKKVTSKMSLNRLISNVGLRLTPKEKILAPTRTNRPKLVLDQQSVTTAPTAQPRFVPVDSISKKNTDSYNLPVNRSITEGAKSLMDLRIDSVYSLGSPSHTIPVTTTANTDVTSPHLATSSGTFNAGLTFANNEPLSAVYPLALSSKKADGSSISFPSFKGLLDTMVDDVIHHTLVDDPTDSDSVTEPTGTPEDDATPSPLSIVTSTDEKSLTKSPMKLSPTECKSSSGKNYAELNGFNEDPYLRVLVDKLDLGPRFTSIELDKLQYYLAYRYRQRTKPKKPKKPSKRKTSRRKSVKTEKQDSGDSNVGNVKKQEVTTPESVKIKVEPGRNSNTDTKKIIQPQKPQKPNPVNPQKMLLINTSNGSYIMPMVPGLSATGVVSALKEGSIKLPIMSKNSQNDIPVEVKDLSELISAPSAIKTIPKLTSLLTKPMNQTGLSPLPQVKSSMPSSIPSENLVLGSSYKSPEQATSPLLNIVITPGTNNLRFSSPAVSSPTSCVVINSSPQQNASTSGISSPRYTKSILNMPTMPTTTKDTVESTHSVGKTDKSPVLDSKGRDQSAIKRLMEHDFTLSKQKRQKRSCTETDNSTKSYISDTQTNVQGRKSELKSPAENLGMSTEKVVSETKEPEKSMDADKPPEPVLSSVDRIKLLREKLKQQQVAVEQAKLQSLETARVLQDMD